MVFEWSAAIPSYALQQLAISFLAVRINQINKASRERIFSTLFGGVLTYSSLQSAPVTAIY